MLVKKKPQTSIVPADTFFYTIPLEPNQLILTRAMLAEHYAVPKGYKAYYGNRVEYVSYSHGIVAISVTLKDNNSHNLYLHVEPGALHVACTCSMPEDKMCHHAYFGLYHLTWSHTLDLSDLYWPGYDLNEQVQARFLNVEVRNNAFTAKPKPQLGQLFRPVIGFGHPDQLPDRNPQPLPNEQNPLQGNREVIAFCVAYGKGSRRMEQLPVLIPCRAQTTTNNVSLQFFREITGVEEVNKLHNVSSDQLTLVDIAGEMQNLLAGFNSRSYDSNLSEHRAVKAAMLLLWEKALHKLAMEPYTHVFTPFRVIYKNGKVVGLSKSFIMPCRVSASRPVLYFALRYHKDHFSLSASVSLNGIEVKMDNKTNLLVVEEDTNTHYLMTSVEADDLLNWMHTHHNRLTVLKEHFALFHDTFLEKLNERYTVYFGSAGRTVLYHYEQISGFLSLPALD
jgi:hypothetical protein